MLNNAFVEQMPNTITEEIEHFCQSIVSGQKPLYVSVMPVPDAEVNRCHINVKQQVHHCGGSSVFGWIIWQSKALLHAEFHCVWQSDDTLIDITPKTDGETKIVFLPDSHHTWNGHVIPSRRQGRIKHPLLSKLLGVLAEMDRIQARYSAYEQIGHFDVGRLKNLELKASGLMVGIHRSWTVCNRNRVAKRRAKNKAQRRNRKRQRNRR